MIPISTQQKFLAFIVTVRHGVLNNWNYNSREEGITDTIPIWLWQKRPHMHWNHETQHRNKVNFEGGIQVN